jgi:phosphatidylglycerol:prolipoprotein diacylglycerol transferase
LINRLKADTQASIALSQENLMLQAMSPLTLAFQFTSPGPILFQRGPLTIRWYGLLIASAVLIGVSLSQYLAKRRKVDPNLLGDLAIWLVIAAIPSARLYYVLFEWEQYAQHPDQILAIWNGGIAIHGAILGGILATTIFARIQKISVWLLADLVVPSLILGQAIGRWGNFFNSEAFGAPTNLPWKLYIPPERRPPEFLNVEYFHPTFLYESLWDLMVFGLLMTLFFRDLKRRPHLKVGTLALVYLVAYSAGRVWIEGLRTDSLMLGPLRMAQVVSLTAIALGLVGLAWLYLLSRSLPDVVPVENRQWDTRAE